MAYYYSSPLDVYKHTRKGCYEEHTIQQFKVNDSDESQNDSGWVNLINEAYTEYGGEKVQQYEQEGCSNGEARDKASEDLF